MNMLRIASISLLAATATFAHEAGIGPNGGMRVDAGPYRVELVPNGTKVDVHVTYDDDGAVDTEAMSGTAILVVDGKPVRVTLAPASPGMLSGEAGTAVSDGVKGAVQIVGPDGVTEQAKF